MKLYERQPISCPISYKAGVSRYSSTGLATMIDIQTKFPYITFEVAYKYGSDAYFDVLTHKEGILFDNWEDMITRIQGICSENGTVWRPNREGIELEENFHRVILNNLKHYLSRNPKKRNNDWILYGNYNIELLPNQLNIYRIRAGETRRIYPKESKYLTHTISIDIPNVRRRLNDN